MDYREAQVLDFLTYAVCLRLEISVEHALFTKEYARQSMIRQYNFAWGQWVAFVHLLTQ